MKPRRIASAVTVAVVTIAAANRYLFTIQKLETSTVTSLLQFFRFRSVNSSYLNNIVIVPEPGVMYTASITGSCSVTFSIALFAVLLLGVIPGAPKHRIVRFGTAAIILATANIIRLLTVVGIGAQYGLDAMIPAHEWVGSSITSIGWIVTILVLLKQRTLRTSNHAFNRNQN